MYVFSSRTRFLAGSLFSNLSLCCFSSLSNAEEHELLSMRQFRTRDFPCCRGLSLSPTNQFFLLLLHHMCETVLLCPIGATICDRMAPVCPFAGNSLSNKLFAPGPCACCCCVFLYVCCMYLSYLISIMFYYSISWRPQYVILRSFLPDAWSGYRNRSLGEKQLRGCFLFLYIASTDVAECSLG